MRLLDPDVLDDHMYEHDWSKEPAAPPAKDVKLSRIYEGYEAGEPVQNIADELGMPKNTVIKWAYDHGWRWKGKRDIQRGRGGLIVGNKIRPLTLQRAGIDRG